MRSQRISALSAGALIFAGLSTVLAFGNLAVDLGGSPIVTEGSAWIVTVIMWSTSLALLSRDVTIDRLESRMDQMEDCIQEMESQVRKRLDEYEARSLLRNWGIRDTERHLKPVK
jgi:hypothetical protein